MTKHAEIALEIYEVSQSSHNFKWRWDRLLFLKPGKFMNILLAPRQFLNLNTRNSPCFDENRRISKTFCMDQFMEQQLECQLPWNPKKSGRI